MKSLRLWSESGWGDDVAEAVAEAVAAGGGEGSMKPVGSRDEVAMKMTWLLWSAPAFVLAAIVCRFSKRGWREANARQALEGLVSEWFARAGNICTCLVRAHVATAAVWSVS